MFRVSRHTSLMASAKKAVRHHEACGFRAGESSRCRLKILPNSFSRRTVSSQAAASSVSGMRTALFGFGIFGTSLAVGYKKGYFTVSDRYLPPPKPAKKATPPLVPAVVEEEPEEDATTEEFETTEEEAATGGEETVEVSEIEGEASVPEEVTDLDISETLLESEETAVEALTEADSTPDVEGESISVAEVSDQAVAEDVTNVVEDASSEVPPVGEEEAATAPVTEDPVTETPTVEEPVAEAPAIEEPVAEAPAIEEPIEVAVEEPITDSTAVEEPLVEEAVAEEPTIVEPVVEAPAVKEPIAEVPAGEEPVVEGLAVEEPVIEAPAIEESVAEASVVEESVVEAAVVEASVVEETMAEVPATEELIVEAPAVEEPVIVAPAVEESIAELSAVEEPVVEAPVVEVPVVVESVAEAPTVEEPLGETPVVQEPVVEAPAVMESVPEAPVVEAPVVEEPLLVAPAIEEPVAEATAVEEPVVEASATEQPVIDTPVVKEPVTEALAVEAPADVEPVSEVTVIEVPVAETPVVEETVAKTPAIEVPVGETPTIEEPVVEVPAVEEASSEEAPVVKSPVVEKPEAEALETEVTIVEAPVTAAIPESAPYVIVGAGTTAHAACRAIRKKDPTAKILVIGEEEVLPYMRPPLSKELWFTEDDDTATTLRYKSWNGKERSVFFESEEYFLKPEELISSEKGGVSVLTGKKVVSVDADLHSVTLHSGESITYNKLLLAPGGKPKSHTAFESVSEDVKERTTLFRTVSDYQRLEKAVRESQHIAIIGSGFLGSELACALAAKGKSTGLQVTQVYPENGNMAKVLPRYLSSWTTNKVKAEGVSIVPEARVTGVEYVDSQVELTLDNGNKVKADHVVVCVGIEPDIDLAKSGGLEVDSELKGFRVNAELEARSDVWVAGDAACFYDIKLGRRRVEHHDHAVVSGRLAGENMTGAKKTYKHQSMFWSDLGPDIGYEAIGICDSKLPTVSVWAKASSADTPKAVVEETGESVRSKSEANASDTTVSLDVNTISDSLSQAQNEPLSEEEFGKGVVFYMREKRVVGILLWNVFNRMALARRIISEDKSYDDVTVLAKLFDIHDTK